MGANFVVVAVSDVFQRPDWQSSITIQSVNPGAITGRCIPDVAANADWNASPYLLVVDGHAEPNGGTSAASPLAIDSQARSSHISIASWQASQHQVMLPSRMPSRRKASSARVTTGSAAV